MSKNIRICAHIPCLCEVPEGQTYCGESCRLAGEEDVEIACQCDHLSCRSHPLRIGNYARRANPAPSDCGLARIWAPRSAAARRITCLSAASACPPS